MTKRSFKERVNTLTDESKRQFVEMLVDRAFEAVILAQAMVAGKARWEPFPNDPVHGEVCVNGLRYATKLEDGIPILDSVLKVAITNEVKHLHGQ